MTLIEKLARSLGFRKPLGERLYTCPESGVYFTHDRESGYLRVYRLRTDELVDFHKLQDGDDPLGYARATEELYDYD